MAKDMLVDVRVHRVSVEQVIKPHIRKLRREKMTYDSIAAAAGMPTPNIHAIMKRKYVTAEVAARILSVTVDDKEPGHDAPVQLKAADTRARIIWLESQGMSVPELAKRCGVARGDLYRLKNGNRKYVTAEVRGRIFAVEPEAIAAKNEPADETCQTLQQLMLRQYTIKNVADGLGIHPGTLGGVLNMRHPNVDVATASAVRKYWTEHEHVLGPSPDAARDAKLRGYPIPPNKMRLEMEYILARRTRNRLQDLSARGFTLDVISEETLVARDELGEVREGKAKYIRRHKAKRILRFYQSTQGQSGESAQTAILARKRTFPQARSWSGKGSDWTDATQMIRELDELTLQQWSPVAIAEACGSNPAIFNRMLSYGQETVMRSTADAVHAYYLDHIEILGPSVSARQAAERRAISPRRGARSVSAYPARLMLRELMLRQFDLVTISTGSGVSNARGSQIRRGDAEKITWATHIRISRYFFEVRGQTGPSTIARNMAINFGFLPMWRSAPEMAMRTAGASINGHSGQTPVDLLVLERSTERGVRRWLLEYNKTLPSLERLSWERSLLYSRFDLRIRVTADSMSVAEYSRVSGRSGSDVRRATRGQLRSLLGNPTTQVGEAHEESLRRYMIHPGLVALGAI